MEGYDIKTAVRQWRRHKGFALINLTGLSIGMAACLMLFLFVSYETGYDGYHENADRIFRVIQRDVVDEEVDTFCGTPAPLAPALVREFPEVVRAVRFSRGGYEIIARGRRFHEPVFSADPSLFEVFDIELVRGDRETALDDPDSILLSESASARLLPDRNPVGEILSLGGRRDLRVAGVFRDIPRNSHLRFDFLRSFTPLHERHQGEWGISNFFTYILLADNASIRGLEEKMPGFIDRHKGPDARRLYGFQWLFQPLTSIHLHSHWRGEISAGTRTGTLYIFSAVAVFMLLIACFNVINLTTARYTGRATEVGLRRVIGASRARLVRQFLIESSLLTLLALPLTLVLVEIGLPAFNRLADRSLRLSAAGDAGGLLVIAGGVLVTGLVSGLYPALYISGFRPAQVFQGRFTRGPSISAFRKGLVVLQFVISLVFIISALVISGQLRFLRSRSPGFERERVVMLPLVEPRMLTRRQALKSEFLSDPRILAAAATSFNPGEPIFRQNFWKEGMPENQYPMIEWFSVDPDFVATFQVEISAGRDFAADRLDAEGGGYLLNQTAVRELGWTPESAVGKLFELGNRGRVVGVIKDFNFRSLHSPVGALALAVYPDFYKYIAIRLRAGEVAAGLAHIERVWKRFALEQPFEFFFLDDQYDSLYRTEQRLSRIFAIVTALSILIACLGLFGLAAFAVERRTREIGIRRVLGASTGRLIWTLLRDFAHWVGLANLIAWPAAYFAMSRWLNGFAYRIAPPLWTFLVSAAIVMAAALATAALRAGRAASLDPVRALRCE